MERLRRKAESAGGRGAAAIAFYCLAFGAEELWRIDAGATWWPAC